MKEEKRVNHNPHADGFYQKPQSLTRTILSKLSYWVLVIYYALQSPSLPTKDKAKIIAALAYLIFPLDLIPDAIPVMGVLDDAALLFALFRLFVTIDDSIRAQAREKTRRWVGE